MYYIVLGTTGFARARYSAYGQPEPVLVGDLDGDGALTDDDRAQLAITRASVTPSGVVTMADGAWTPDADLNFDGVIDETDASLLTNLVSQGGVSAPGDLWHDSPNLLRGVTIGYAGMVYDRALGAWLMRNRWHSPTLGRFLSRDPAGYVDGMSLYAYVSGNPLKYWDPLGLEACGYDFFGVPLWETLAQLRGASDQVVVEMAADAWAGLVDVSVRSTMQGGIGAPGVAAVMTEDTINAGEERARQLSGGVEPSGWKIARASLGHITGFNDIVDAGVGLTEGIDIYGNKVYPMDALAQGSRGVSLAAGTFAGFGAGLKKLLSVGGKETITQPASTTADGRLGSASTRSHVSQVQDEFRSRGYTVTHGGTLGEEYIPGPGGARAGSAYPDITATKNGRTLRVNTVDTLSDGATPTARETRNAKKIRRLRPGDHLLLVPKPKPLPKPKQ